METIGKKWAGTSKLRRLAVLVVGGVMGFAVMSQAASADTLHGFCWGGAPCTDSGSNTPTSTNPPQFGFTVSPGPQTGDFVLVFLVPVGDGIQPSSIGVGGTASGTATLFSSTPWTGGQLDSYLGISASPTNSYGAFSDGNVSDDGFYVYEANLGQQTLGKNNKPSDSPQETSDALPQDSYILGFLNTGTANDPSWNATANSGAIFEKDPPPSTPSVPEPSSLMLLGTGALGLAGAVRRRFRRA